MNDAVKRGVSAGKDPMGLAAAVLFASCTKTGEQKSKIDLANAGQTTDATIRKRFKELKDRLDLHDQSYSLPTLYYPVVKDLCVNEGR